MILVVGATGYIGRYLCPYLISKGHEVLALGRSSLAFEFFKKMNVPCQYFDFNESKSFSNLPGQVDAVIDLSACLAEHETPVENFFSINTIGCYKMLEYCSKKNIKKFVLASSHKVYNDVKDYEISEQTPISFKGAHSPYIISKIAAEKFVDYYNKDFGLNGIVMRLTGVRGYGEILGHLYMDGTYHKSALEIFFEKAIRGETIEVWGDQTIKRDHIYIKDVISAFEKAAISKNVQGVYNIASGVAHSQYDEAVAISSVFGNKENLNIVCLKGMQGLDRGYVYNINKAIADLQWIPIYSDLIAMYEDYKKEWTSKIYRNYHFIKEGQAPLSL